jgi:hypothetical protein
VTAKHNKKRNTAFLYETLVKQLTRAIVDKDGRQKRAILSTLKEFFGRDSLLRKELECYQTLLECASLDAHTAEKLLHETKVDRARLDNKMIFDAQSKLIKQMKTTLSSEVWNNFIPNYKSLASINAIFNQKTPAKKRVLYENTIVAALTTEAGNDAVLQPIDNIVYRSFVERFNNEYAGLLEEQKSLLAQYISSFADNGIEFKLHLNEELGRLKSKIGASLELHEIRSDEEMLTKTRAVIDILEGFKTMPPTEELVRRVLKIQALAREVNS